MCIACSDQPYLQRELKCPFPGFRAFDVDGCGHYFFGALAVIMYGDETRWGDIRLEVAKQFLAQGVFNQYMLNAQLAADIRNAVGQNPTAADFDKWVQETVANFNPLVGEQAYGEILHAQAFADAKQINIVLHAVNYEDQDVAVPVQPLAGAAARTIHIWNTPNHWVALLPAAEPMPQRQAPATPAEAAKSASRCCVKGCVNEAARLCGHCEEAPLCGEVHHMLLHTSACVQKNAVDLNQPQAAAVGKCAWCSAPCDTQCGRCHDEYYCRQKCLNLHWKIHRLICPLQTDQRDRELYRGARAALFSGIPNPVCVICRGDRTKREQKKILSHLIGRSVLRTAGSGVSSFNVATGVAVGYNQLGYQGYCQRCETAQQYGENHFNPAVHEPLAEDIAAQLSISAAQAPNVYHNVISMAWRGLALMDVAGEASVNGVFVRNWLAKLRPYVQDGANQAFAKLAVKYSTVFAAVASSAVLQRWGDHATGYTRTYSFGLPAFRLVTATKYGHQQLTLSMNIFIGPVMFSLNMAVVEGASAGFVAVRAAAPWQIPPIKSRATCNELAEVMPGVFATAFTSVIRAKVASVGDAKSAKKSIEPQGDVNFLPPSSVIIDVGAGSKPKPPKFNHHEVLRHSPANSGPSAVSVSLMGPIGKKVNVKVDPVIVYVEWHDGKRTVRMWLESTGAGDKAVLRWHRDVQHISFAPPLSVDLLAGIQAIVTALRDSAK